LLSIVSFCLMRLDKHRAKKQKWRISEATLIFFALLGPIGSLCAMTVKHSRHKVKKAYFWWAVIIGMLLWGTCFFLVATFKAN